MKPGKSQQSNTVRQPANTQKPAGKPAGKPVTRPATKSTRQPIKASQEKTKEVYEREKARQERFLSNQPYVPYITLSAGDNVLRFLPPWTDQGPNAFNWFRQVFKHYGVTAKIDPDDDMKFYINCAVMSPNAEHYLGVPQDLITCEICNYVKELKATGQPEDAQLAKDIKAKICYVSNVIDINDPVWTKKAIEIIKSEKKIPDKLLPKIGTPKIQTYNYGVTVFNGLCDTFQSTDFTDLETGRNMKIIKEGSGIETKYRVAPELQISPATITVDDYDLIHDLDKLQSLQFLTNEQLTMILEGGTMEEVYSLLPGEPAKQLSAAKKKQNKAAVEEESEEDEGDVEDDEEAVESEEEGDGDDVGDIEGTDDSEAADDDVGDDDGEDQDDDGETPDDDGEASEDDEIDYLSLTDEDIENPAHDGHVPCYGSETEHNPKDNACVECGLFERCADRVAAKKANKKPGNGKPGRGRPPGKANTQTAPKTETKPAAKTSGKSSNVIDLEAEMRAALGKGKR
jgi:hypothetical protein